MRSIYLVAAVGGLASSFSACGGEDHASVPIEARGGSPTNKGGARATAGSKNTAGSAGTASDGGASGDGELAPNIEITAPIAVADPNDEHVLSGEKITATCKVTRPLAVGSSPVNAASVKLAILGADDTVIEEKVATPTGSADEYEYEFNVTAVPAGVVTFRCQAEDVEKRNATTQLSSLLDKGPTITFVKPPANSLQALSQPLDIEFTVDAAPLNKSDDKAAIDKVALSIAGKAIGLATASDKPGHYRLQVNLADGKLFNPSPNGPSPVTVEAANKRTPTPVKAIAEQSVSVDGAGPTIVISSPTQKAVVGGTVRLSFTVTDKVAGVDPNTVVVSLNMVDHAYDPTSDSWTANGDTYTFSFDSRQVQDAKVQITVNVGASDKVGNASTGASELLYLDNYPPAVDLDPLNIRTRAVAGGACSASFDPVGDGARSDLDVVARAGIFRAIVWDYTNSDREIPILHFSNTNQNSVRLYLEADNEKPLLIDTDDNGTCDDVAEIDSTDSLELNVVPAGGSPWFAADDATAPSAQSLSCTTQLGTATPELMCTNKVSDMWQTIKDIYNDTPVVYAPSVTSGLECTGVSWEFGTKIGADGWVCFAARAVDNAGNVGVSRPLRICVDDPKRPGTPACANSSVVAPSCTDGCMIPARWGNKLVLQ